MTFFKHFLILLVLLILFPICFTQIEAPKDDPIQAPIEDEPHYKDGKHNPSLIFFFEHFFVCF